MWLQIAAAWRKLVLFFCGRTMEKRSRRSLCMHQAELVWLAQMVCDQQTFLGFFFSFFCLPGTTRAKRKIGSLLPLNGSSCGLMPVLLLSFNLLSLFIPYSASSFCTQRPLPIFIQQMLPIIPTFLPSFADSLKARVHMQAFISFCFFWIDFFPLQ